MHDVLLINISDAQKSGENVYNVLEDSYISEYFTSDKKLIQIEKEKAAAVKNQCEEKLKRLGISSVTIDSIKLQRK